MLKLKAFKAKKINKNELSKLNGGCVCITKNVSTGEMEDTIIDGVYSGPENDETVGIPLDKL